MRFPWAATSRAIWRPRPPARDRILSRGDNRILAGRVDLCHGRCAVRLGNWIGHSSPILVLIGRSRAPLARLGPWRGVTPRRGPPRAGVEWASSRGAHASNTHREPPGGATRRRARG